MPAVDCFFVLKTVPDVLCGPQVGGSCPGLHTYKRCWPSRTRTAKMLSKRCLTSLLKRSARRWAEKCQTIMNAARCLTRTAKRWRSRFPWKSVPALISQGTVQPLFFSSTISLSHFIVVFYREPIISKPAYGRLGSRSGMSRALVYVVRRKFSL